MRDSVISNSLSVCDSVTSNSLSVRDSEQGAAGGSPEASCSKLFSTENMELFISIALFNNAQYRLYTFSDFRRFYNIGEYCSVLLISVLETCLVI